MVVSRSPEQKFVSQNYSDRIALMPISVALIVGWTLAGFSFIGALWLLPYELIGGLVLLAATLVFTGYMWVLTRRMVADSHLRYELLFTPREAILYTYDTEARTQTVQSVMLKQIQLAEYFSAQDVASLILVSPSHNLEIPLWAFGKRSYQILDVVKSLGVPIENVEHTTSGTAF